MEIVATEKYSLVVHVFTVGIRNLYYRGWRGKGFYWSKCVIFFNAFADILTVALFYLHLKDLRPRYSLGLFTAGINKFEFYVN